MKKVFIIAVVSIMVLGTGLGLLVYYTTRPDGAKGPRPTLGHFGSAADFIAAFKAGQSNGREATDGMMMKSAAPTAAPQGAATGETAAPQHSTTNVQVEGVDEADIVKNDGNFIYAIGGNTVYIVAAYPPEQARVVAKLPFAKNENLNELFIKDNKLAVIGSTGYGAVPMQGESVAPIQGATFVKVYDITIRQKPALLRTVEYEGSYSTSRMVGDNVHVVLSSAPYRIMLDEEKGVKASDIIPQVRDSQGAPSGDFAPAVGYRQIEVVDPDRFTSFLTVMSLSLKDGDKNLGKKVIAGYSDNVYASTENLYVSSSNYQYYGFNEVPGDTQESTTVYKFKFDGPSTSYLSSATVPGTILNQFSMDETKGNFRIATTLGHVSREGDSNATNNVYVLTPDMQLTGRLEGLAPGERIYSVRFMGDRAYMVTFKKVDPLFVLDLADPGAPKVLGELKIPGFSDYLHPYDATHVIGVGKNTVEAAPEEGGNFAWYQGMKIAIFDVTDVANPKEMHKVEIGDRGTDSYALEDHKAFLFDRAKNLLVLPVSLAELTAEQKGSATHQPNDYGKYTFQGAYVYDVSLEGGFQLKGRITHIDNDSQLESGGYGYYGSDQAVRRSLWIGDALYTMSEAKIKANRLSDLGELAAVPLQ